MRKVLLFSLLFVALLTGCSNNEAEGNPLNGGIKGNVQRLVCSQKVQTVDVNMIGDFKGDELTYLGLKYTMDLSAYNDAQINAIKAQDMCGTVKASMSTYSSSFTNCKQSVENKNLIITADFDLEKLMTGEIKKEAKLADVKKSLEQQNYSCTINK